jgi:hypothetical protein
MKHRFRVIAGLFLALQLNAAPAEVLPWSGHDAVPDSIEEKGLWAEANEFDQAMARAG